MADNLPATWNKQGIQLNSLDDVREFAQIIIKSGMAPKDMQRIEQVIVALQWGREIGLSPMQSLQSITVIKGRPSIWGDALPALVQASGLCAYIKEEVITDEDGSKGYEITSKRKDQSHPIVTRFTTAMAKTAGLWNSTPSWKQYPQRMLKMRARAWNLRDNFADVLRGIAVAEEAEDMPAATERYQPQPAMQVVSDEPQQPIDDPLLDGDFEVVEDDGISEEEADAIRQAEIEEAQDTLY